MSTTRINKLHVCAKKFRLAIEKCDKKILPSSFFDFPRGSCSDTCLILGKYLQDSGMGLFTYVSGEIYQVNGDHYTHAWLSQDEIIVDITADQFDTIQQKVIVSTDSNWHKGFNIASENCADLEKYDCYTQAELFDCYNKIIKHLL